MKRYDLLESNFVVEGGTVCEIRVCAGQALYSAVVEAYLVGNLSYTADLYANDSPFKHYMSNLWSSDRDSEFLRHRWNRT